MDIRTAKRILNESGYILEAKRGPRDAEFLGLKLSRERFKSDDEYRYAAMWVRKADKLIKAIKKNPKEYFKEEGFYDFNKGKLINDGNRVFDRKWKVDMTRYFDDDIIEVMRDYVGLPAMEKEYRAKIDKLLAKFKSVGIVPYDDIEKDEEYMLKLKFKDISEEDISFELRFKLLQEFDPDGELPYGSVTIDGIVGVNRKRNIKRTVDGLAELHDEYTPERAKYLRDRARKAEQDMYDDMDRYYRSGGRNWSGD